MDRRTKICLWVILLGLANFLVYVVMYWYLWGEAINGRVEILNGQALYFLHRNEHPVSKAMFIYSGIHSISIPLTVGAIMLAMLTLAKERISSSMRSAIIRGRTLLTILAVVITAIVAIWTGAFICQFAGHFETAAAVSLLIAR